ncbi:hypothetical protein YPPY54_3670, partial [Yersinia pestis PY-54]
MMYIMFYLIKRSDQNEQILTTTTFYPLFIF